MAYFRDIYTWKISDKICKESDRISACHEKMHPMSDFTHGAHVSCDEDFSQRLFLSEILGHLHPISGGIYIIVAVLCDTVDLFLSRPS